MELEAVECGEGIEENTIYGNFSASDTWDRTQWDRTHKLPIIFLGYNPPFVEILQLQVTLDNQHGELSSYYWARFGGQDMTI